MKVQADLEGRGNRVGVLGGGPPHPVIVVVAAIPIPPTGGVPPLPLVCLRATGGAEVARDHFGKFTGIIVITIATIRL